MGDADGRDGNGTSKYNDLKHQAMKIDRGQNNGKKP